MKSKRKIITIIPASSCCKAWHSSWWSPCDIQQWSCSPGWILGAYSHIPSSLFLTPSTSVWSPTRLTYASLLSVIHLHQSHFLMQHFIFPHAISFSKFLEICPSKCPGIQEISCWVIDSLSCGPRQSIPTLYTWDEQVRNPWHNASRRRLQIETTAVSHPNNVKQRVGSTLNSSVCGSWQEWCADW